MNPHIDPDIHAVHHAKVKACQREACNNTKHDSVGIAWWSWVQYGDEDEYSYECLWFCSAGCLLIAAPPEGSA